MKLWVPANEERRQVVDEGSSHTRMAKDTTRLLKQIDPYLEVVFIGERAPNYPGIMPGRWHVRRAAPDVLDIYLPIAGPNGEYREPSAGVVEEMKQRDLWRQGALQDLRDREERERKRIAQAEETAREARLEQVGASVRAARRLPGDGGMTKRRWGRGIVGH